MEYEYTLIRLDMLALIAVSNYYTVKLSDRLPLCFSFWLGKRFAKSTLCNKIYQLYLKIYTQQSS